MARPAPHARVAVRAILAVVAGLVTGPVAGAAWGWAAGLLVGWATAAVIVTAWTLIWVWPMDAAQTRAHATAEDPGRGVTRVVGIVGSVASIGAVVAILTQTKHAAPFMAWILAGIALLSVVSSWLLIQTAYLVRIADTYYGEPVGGIMFNQTADPTYTDFAYVSFGVGLAYQVADTNLTTNEMRRVVIAQSLLGYLFGAVILGTIINLLAGL